MDDKTKSCPSSKALPGAGLLGVRQPDGRIALLPEVLPVDDDFISIAQQDPVPLEQRFRFTNSCLENGCKQWNKNGCGIVHRVVKYIDQVNSIDELPSCGIRSTCRWFSQEGANACKVCTYIVTEISQEEVDKKKASLNPGL